MDRSVERAHLDVMHQQVTIEVARLMEGFYSNLEDGLFELAYRDADTQYQGYCFNLMRELRFRRQALMDLFVKRMNQSSTRWYESAEDGAELGELDQLAMEMSRKCSAHFSGLLGKIAERSEAVAGRKHSLASLPIGPYQVARQFVHSCHRIDFDTAAIQVVQDLFLRFVLDRMGAAYGQFLQKLNTAGLEGEHALSA